jgi:hypothetical protein
MNRENLTIINDGGKEERCQYGLLDRVGFSISFSRCNAWALLLVLTNIKNLSTHAKWLCASLVGAEAGK